MPSWSDVVGEVSAKFPSNIVDTRRIGKFDFSFSLLTFNGLVCVVGDVELRARI